MIVAESYTRAQTLKRAKIRKKTLIRFRERLAPIDKKKCDCIAIYVFIQGMLVIIGAFTILECHWSPYATQTDYNKLARIMYLYDYKMCNYTIKREKRVTFQELAMSIQEADIVDMQIYKLNQRTPETVKSTKLSTKTRLYVKSSIGLHIIWMVNAMLLIILTEVKIKLRRFKCFLVYYFYYTILMVAFDMSMAIVYVAHIQQSLTKNMVLRYSGWSVEMTVNSPDEFAGWLPIAASISWLKGIIGTIINILNARTIRYIRLQIRRKEVDKKVEKMINEMIPDPFIHYPQEDDIMLFRRP